MADTHRSARQEGDIVNLINDLEAGDVVKAESERNSRTGSYRADIDVAGKKVLTDTQNVRIVLVYGENQNSSRGATALLIAEEYKVDSPIKYHEKEATIKLSAKSMEQDIGSLRVVQ